MEIKTILRRNLFILDLEATNKDSVLKELSQKLCSEGYIRNQDAFLTKLKERESLSTTGVGRGIAIPHAKSKELDEAVVLFARSEKGIDFDSLDGKLTYNFFMIATPLRSKDSHLKILANLSSQLMHKNIQEKLNDVRDFDSLLDVFKLKATRSVNLAPKTLNIVAVSACATGIAHTYMAAEKLHKLGEAKSYAVRVETNGMAGVEYKLSKQEIKDADIVIIAADIKIDKRRFDGKKMVSVPTSEVINDPEGVVEKALKAPSYDSSGKRVKTQKRNGTWALHLNAGFSYMMPFIVAGGVIMALSFLVERLVGLPFEIFDNTDIFNTFIGYSRDLGTLTLNYMYPVLAAYIAKSIASRPGLVAGAVAGGIAMVSGSGLFGVVIGGFLAGYVMNIIKGALKNTPKILINMKKVLLYPVLGVGIVGFIMLALSIPMSSLNALLNDTLNGLSNVNATILGVVLGAMMAYDLGGPVNKTAYLFATAGLIASASTGGSSAMAAVMAAGMVPPLATFVATRLFRQKYNLEEREIGLTNLILGASFITEGALPFVEIESKETTLSFMIGAAVAAGLVRMSNIMSVAPHGGVFVIILTNKPLLYLAYIILGSCISGILMGLFKKKSY